jgi:ABC-type glycerol-3-phosphate transport system substrate-binding protein
MKTLIGGISVKKFIRILTALLIILLVALPVSCSGDSTSSKPAANSAAPSGKERKGNGKEKKGKDATVEFTYWESSPSDKAGFDLMIGKFAEDHPEIRLKPQIYPDNTYLDQLDTRIAANDWPDVIRYTYQRLGKFKEGDVMLDLTDKVSRENVDALVPAYRSALTYNGKLVGMPHHTDTIGVFYNKRMFKESDIRIPKDAMDGWTWKELTEIAEKLKKDHKLDYAFTGIWENRSGYRYLPFLYMNGGSVLSDDQETVTMDSPKNLEAVKLFEKWRKEDLVVKGGFTQEQQANMLFVAEKIAFVFSGSWHCSYMEENMAGNWGVTYMPQKDGKTGSDMGGNALFAYKGTECPEACGNFIDYMTSKDNVREFCEAGNFIPVRQDVIDDGLKYSEFQEEMDTFLDIVGTIDPKMAEDETSSHFQQLNTIWSEEMDPLAVDGSASAEQVLQNCQARMEKEFTK